MFWLLPILNTAAILTTVGTIIYGIWVAYIFRRSRKFMPEIAYLDGFLPVVGHIIFFIVTCPDSTVLWDKLSEYVDYYNDGFYGQVGHQSWIFLADHHVIQELLSSHEAVEKNYIYRMLSVITDGVFIAPGVRWRKLRKRLNLTFSQKQVDSYFEPTNARTERMSSVVVKQLAQSEQYVDVQPYIARCFFDIMTKTHFDIETDEQVKDEHHVCEVTSKVIDLIFQNAFLKPYMHLDFIYRQTPLYKYIEQIKEKPTKYVSYLAETRLKMYDENKNVSNNDDFLIYSDLVIEAMKEMNLPQTGLDLHLNSTDILIAGSDTTSVAGAALLYYLALHKDIQEKVYQEVSQVYGQDSTKPLTKQELASFTYLDMCLNEALRKSCPNGIARGLIVNLDVGKYIIPKGTNIYILMQAQNQNPRYFERVDEFYPEHFTKEAVKARPKMAFIPFSHGPRNCPGKAFAYILLKTMAAILVNNYILDTNLPENKITYKMILMTQHNEGYPIKFTPRHNNQTERSR